MLKGRRAVLSFICLIGVMLILVGLRIGEEDFGLNILKVPAEAVFETGEIWERVDFEGNINDAENILRQLEAREIRREVFCQYSVSDVRCTKIDACLIVIYAFSDRLALWTEERWGKFNVMIAVRGNRIAVGYPVLIGSF